ncbi:MAG: DedA family protein [Coriobacteriia bacterium]|nr:DedA family protein [Coriobacteriia bacterium]
MVAFFQSLLDWALSALGSYGYVIVFLATVLENLFIVGSFTPGDVITASAAFTATQPAGASLSVWGLFAAATLGTWTGTTISYIIGRRGGAALIQSVGPRFGISLEAIEAGEEYFERRGPFTIVFARFIAVMKNLAPAIAGASKMKVAVFQAFSLLGSVMYAGILVGVGWFLGENFQQGLKYFGAFSWLLFVIVFVVAAVGWYGKRRRDKRVLALGAARYEAAHGSLQEPDDDA